jgi:N-acetylneuraminic acid mutarotase
MKNKRAAQSAPVRHSLGEGGFANRRVLVAILLCAAAACSVVSGTLLAFLRAEAPSKVSHPAAAGLTFAERVAYQRAVEEVYWRHRIWPNERPDPKPSLDAIMSQAQLEKKVADYLRESQALEDYWQRPITANQLQTEMERIASHTKQPDVLRELFDALGNDPFVIAECLARPIVAERLVTALGAHGVRFEGELRQSWLTKVGTQVPVTIAAASANYTLPLIVGPSDSWSPSVLCTEDTWNPTSTAGAPAPRGYHTAVWTGTEMIVWGGTGDSTGGRYDPVTDGWTATTITNAPSPRTQHTAVWTGSEMIVWGGGDGLNTGGRYDPTTDSWIATATTNAPSGRYGQTAVWTGSEMIVWGGGSNGTNFNTGGRYNPNTDSWTATSTFNAPSPRSGHTAVWTGSKMVIWGGYSGGFSNTGGRYDPSTNTWTATATANAPSARQSHTAVWTGTEMIVWGGDDTGGLNTGGKYNPGTDSWTATSTTNAPDGRFFPTAVWTGSEMIVWGGVENGGLNTGGKYNPGTDSWTATSTTNAPDGRSAHTAVWTGSEMIVWGGYIINITNTGGRYCGVGQSQVVLYDQYNNAGTYATVSATFTDSPPNNSDLADDFVVPAGQTWHVYSIYADGGYFNGTGPAIDWNVFFYTNNAGFPGTQIYSAAHQPAVQSGTTFTVNLPAPALLNAGTYWVEIQPNMTFSTQGEWGWTDRMVTSNNAAAWQNPGGGFGTCPTWSRRGATCNIDPSEPDQVYALIGTIGGPTPTPTASPTPTATPTPTPTPTPCTGRCAPTPRPNPTSAGRPTPPPRLTPPPSASPGVTPAPRPTAPPHLTPPPTPTGSSRPTPAPRP